jgi:hypothetical protein
MQIFHRSTNTISRATIYGAVFLVAVLLWAVLELQRCRLAISTMLVDWALTAAIVIPRWRIPRLPEFLQPKPA